MERNLGGAIAALTDPAAVILAMDEFDRLGRDQFNRRYGFGGAARYWLERGGRRYDAKSVILAAHGMQHPERGPLTNDQVRSNREDVRGTLERLGFAVIDGRDAGVQPSIFRPLDPGEVAEITGDQDPTTAEDVQEHLTALARALEDVPSLTDLKASTGSPSLRRAQDVAFRVAVRRAYGDRCAVCGSGLRSPDGSPEVQAAHIFPKERDGSDDVRNGLALCRLHHWAFDAGWWSLTDDHRVVGRVGIPDDPEYGVVRDVVGRRIQTPSDGVLSPHPVFLAAHRLLHSLET